MEVTIFRIAITVCCMMFVTSVEEKLILKIGVVADSCHPLFPKNISKSLIESETAQNKSLTADLYWKFVKVTEPYSVLQAILELVSLRVDKIIIAANVPNLPHLDGHLGNVTDLLVKWGRENWSSDALNDLCRKWAESQMLDVVTKPDICEKPSGNFKTVETPLSVESESHVIEMFTAIIHHLKWTSTCILYEQEIEYEALLLTESLSRIGVTVIMNKTDDLEKTSLKGIVSNNMKAITAAKSNITYLCKAACLHQVFEKPLGFTRDQVDRESMRHLSNWLVGVFTDESLDDIGKIATEIDNIATIVLPLHVLKNVSAQYNNLGTTIRDILYKISLQNTTQDLDQLKNSAIERLNKLNEDNTTMCKWYPIRTLMWHPDGRGFDTVAYVQMYGTLLIRGEIFPNIKHAFNGRHLIISVNKWDPFVNSISNGTFDGFCKDLLDHLVTALNFTYNITVPADLEWGVNESGTWTGLVGQISRNEVDLIAGPLTVTVEREEVMDFTHPFFYEYTRILMKKLDPSHRKWRTFLDPFSGYVLLCIGIALPVMSFLLFLVERLNPYYKELGESGTAYHSIRSFSDAFWYMFGALLTQGGEHMPESTSGRTLLSFWWIFCLITMASYCGNLIAFLTVSKDKLPFQNIQELVQQDNYKWGLTSGTYWVDQFGTSSVPELKRAWEGIINFNRSDPSVLNSDPNTHVEKVLRENYVFIGDKTLFEVKMANKCQLVSTNEELLPSQYAFGLPNNSAYTKLFSDEMLKVHESGLLQIWKIRSWPKQNFCKGNIVTEAKRITFIDIQSAFYLIAIGIVAGAIALGGEFTRYYYRKWRHKNDPFHKSSSNIIHLKTNRRASTMFGHSKHTSHRNHSNHHNGHHLTDIIHRHHTECYNMSETELT